MTRGVCLEDSRSSKQRAASSAGAPFKRRRAPPVEALDELRGVCCWPLRFVRSIPLRHSRPTRLFSPLSLSYLTKETQVSFFLPSQVAEEHQRKTKRPSEVAPLVSIKSLLFCDYFLFSKNRNKIFRNNALALFLGFFFSRNI